MAKTYLFPYKDGSASAKALATALGIKRIKREGSHYKAKVGKTVINWGCSEIPMSIMSHPAQVVNNPGLVKAVTNKLTFFQMMEPELVVPWTEDGAEVAQWLREGKTVVARTILNGHSGAGISILQGADEIIEAPLYTLYVPKKHEYRVHCWAGGVFDVQQKKRKADVADNDVDWRVRNLAGGFIYARDDLNVPQCVRDVALKVFQATGLDFGAVDIIYNEKNDRAYALEINTAPGLSGTTLDKYVEMFREMLNE